MSAIRYRCDSCAREYHDGAYCTDEEACGGGDGPGFLLCSERSCLAQREGMTRAELLADYRRGREAGERIEAILCELDRRRFGEE